MKATYEITAKMNLKGIIAESREVAQALNEFTDNLESIEGKYAEPKTDVLDKIRVEIMSKDGLEEALEIIDKYRESEVKDGRLDGRGTVKN